MDITDELPNLAVRCDASPILCRWSPNGQLLLVGTEDRRLTALEHPSFTIGQPRFSYLTRSGRFRAEWSPDSKWIAVVDGAELTILHAERGATSGSLSLPTPIRSVSWSPDSKYIAVSPQTAGAVYMIQSDGLEIVSEYLTAERESVLSWSPQGGRVSLVSRGIPIRVPPSLRILEFDKNAVVEMVYVGDPHRRNLITSHAWVSDKILLTYGQDRAVNVWDGDRSSALVRTIEVPDLGRPVSVSLTTDKSLAVIQGMDGAAICNTGNWSMGPQLNMPVLLPTTESSGADMRPNSLTYAFCSNSRTVKLIDLSAVNNDHDQVDVQRYRNAKVVVVGDTGVGKTALSEALCGLPYRPTSSTHGRVVHTLSAERLDSGEGQLEHREVLLWDLAGQPGYRLFHQLSLRGISLALLVFDARSESDPFRGVRYWSNAVRTAVRDAPVPIMLVTARVDRGGLSVSSARIADCVAELGFTGHFETSAETRQGISALLHAASSAIDWQGIPEITAPSIFFAVQGFIVKRRLDGPLLATAASLRNEFFDSSHVEVDSGVFGIALQRLETAGLIMQIVLDDLWLLQPEVLDSYVQWLGNAARNEPDGLGFVDEQDAIRGRFPHQELGSIHDEKMMLLAAVEEVVGRGLVLRVPTDRGEMLVFPSEVRSDSSIFPGSYAQTIRFEFIGPISAVYAAIVVRLANSIVFQRDQLYSGVALFSATRAQICGLMVTFNRKGDDSTGQLIVFFGDDVEIDVRLLFLRYINEHLADLAMPGSIRRLRIYQCSNSHPPIPDEFIDIRRNENAETVICPGCGEHLVLDDLVEQSSQHDTRIQQMSEDAQVIQLAEQRRTVFSAREAARQYDIFLSYNSLDKVAVTRLAKMLRVRGILPWIDADKMIPGDQPVAELEKIIDNVPVVGIVMGPYDLGRWQKHEYYALLSRRISAEDVRKMPRIVPILLPGGGNPLDLPAFLRTFSFVDLTGGLDNREGFANLMSVFA